MILIIMNSDHNIFKYMIETRNKINRTKYNNEYSHVALFTSKKIKKERIANELNNNFTIGINSTRIRYNNIDIKTHAEMDAMERLKLSATLNLINLQQLLFATRVSTNSQEYRISL